MIDALAARVRDAFAADGTAPELLVQSPGRVNLIGEHTDYNGGFVLPAAIDYGTVIGARRRLDDRIRVLSTDFDPDPDEFPVVAPVPRSDDKPWANYVRGAVSVLLGRGHPVGGADLVIAGDVPRGAGLSSSASLSVALQRMFQLLRSNGGGKDDGLTPTDLALLAQAVENEYIGVNCGNMDQLISARGVAGHALLIDCRSLETQPYAIPDGFKLLIAHSGVRRGLVESEYNRRREECGRAAAFFGVPTLRDVSAEQVVACPPGLDDVAFRRARHIVTENARVIATCRALTHGDIATVSELMAGSHRSMRDDFQITVPKVDELVGVIADVVGSRGGARMTGGGFGGCVVALVPAGLLDDARRAVSDRYRDPQGELATIYVCQASAGMSVVATD